MGLKFMQRSTEKKALETKKTDEHKEVGTIIAITLLHARQYRSFWCRMYGFLSSQSLAVSSFWKETLNPQPPQADFILKDLEMKRTKQTRQRPQQRMELLLTTQR